VIPYSNSLVKKAKVPLALILQPYLSASAEKVNKYRYIYKSRTYTCCCIDGGSGCK
jgi:hypothetical protein